MTALEVAVGLPFGEDGEPAVLVRDGPQDPVVALEQSMLPALRQGPCLVAFSGGWDSARVLACAVRAARSEGLELPVPISMRARGELDVRDRELPMGRQEQLVRFLGIADWERVELGEDVDYLGTVAAGMLCRHGAMFPANVHLIAPMLERARGRTLIVGHSGRDLLEFWRGRCVCDLLARRRRPDRLALAEAAMAAAPWQLRALRLRRTIEPPAWLTNEAREVFIRKRADELAGEPLFWTEAVARASVKRCLRATWQSFAKLAEDHSVTVETPYRALEFLSALARAGGRLGWGGEEEFFRHFDSRILPPLHAPSRRAPTAPQPTGSDPFWGPAARAFAETWDGRGLDPALVDAETLRSAWLDGHHQAALLLQSAWLERSAAPQPV